ncbi:MAG: hypothetical protein VKK59_01695 [Vampirovibrionales bacterium]|nr:hypothetical protein [Vampirovibrionales bacterium]
MSTSTEAGLHAAPFSPATASLSDVQRNQWLRHTLGLPSELHTLLATWPDEALNQQLALLHAPLSADTLAKHLLAMLDQGRQKLQLMSSAPGAWRAPGNSSAGKQASDLLQQLSQFATQVRQNPMMAAQVLTLMTIAWQPVAPLQQLRVSIPPSEGLPDESSESREVMHSVQVYLQTRQFGRLRFILQESAIAATSWQILGYGLHHDDAKWQIKTAVNANLPSALGRPEWLWMTEATQLANAPLNDVAALEAKSLSDGSALPPLCLEADTTQARVTALDPASAESVASASIHPSGKATARLLTAATTLVSSMLKLDAA